MRAPIYVSQLELTEAVTGLSLPAAADGQAYTGVHLLVRLQRAPVGYVHLPADHLDAEAVRAGVWREFGAQVNRRRASAGLAALSDLPATGLPAEAKLEQKPTELPTITVAVCTRDRPESLIQTLRTIAALEYPAFDVLVVDNAPSSDATLHAVQESYGSDPRFRYVREPRPGLSCARNRALREASGDVLAFTDDDVLVDRWWLEGVARGFQAANDVACVTGLIATEELENEAQLYFHLRQQWGESCATKVFDLDQHRDDSPIYPYSAGIFGAGANFSVSRTLLKAVGGFNEALGAGTPAGGGEDLNLFMRVILSGHRLVYEPTAVVHHRHRTELSALTRQMRGYGAGATASLFALALSSSRARRELPVKIMLGVPRVLRLRDPGEETSEHPSLPQGLLGLERRGLALGPWLYLKGRRRVRQLAAGGGA